MKDNFKPMLTVIPPDVFNMLWQLFLQYLPRNSQMSTVASQLSSTVTTPLNFDNPYGLSSNCARWVPIVQVVVGNRATYISLLTVHKLIFIMHPNMLYCLLLSVVAV